MSGDRDTLRLRSAARAVLIDPARSILLVHFDGPELDLPGGFWACPGGGPVDDEDEDEISSLRRELWDDVGLALAEPGPAVWRSRRLFELNGWDGQEDTYYLVETEHFTPIPTLSLTQLHAGNVHGQRWWTVDEIRAGHATFAPRRLGEYLQELLTGGPPRQPRLIDAR